MALRIGPYGTVVCELDLTGVGCLKLILMDSFGIVIGILLFDVGKNQLT